MRIGCTVRDSDPLRSNVGLCGQKPWLCLAQRREHEQRALTHTTPSNVPWACFSWPPRRRLSALGNPAAPPPPPPAAWPRLSMIWPPSCGRPCWPIAPSPGPGHAYGRPTYPTPAADCPGPGGDAVLTVLGTMILATPTSPSGSAFSPAPPHHPPAFALPRVRGCTGTSTARNRRSGSLAAMAGQAQLTTSVTRRR